MNPEQGKQPAAEHSFTATRGQLADPRAFLYFVRSVLEDMTMAVSAKGQSLKLTHFSIDTTPLVDALSEYENLEPSRYDELVARVPAMLKEQEDRLLAELAASGQKALPSLSLPAFFQESSGVTGNLLSAAKSLIWAPEYEVFVRARCHLAELSSSAAFSTISDARSSGL